MIQSMGSPEYSPPMPVVDTSRPSLGFPLGTGLLLIMIFSLSGIFSCCYHWDKLRSFRRSFSDNNNNGAATVTVAHASVAVVVADEDATKIKFANSQWKNSKNESLPVIMPGDQIPKFIALPCPCQPPQTEEKITVEVQKPPKPPPPRIAIPLY